MYNKIWVILLMMFSLLSCDSFGDGDCVVIPDTKKTITVKIQLPDYDTRASVEAPLSGVGVEIKYVDVYFYNTISGEIHTRVSLGAGDIAKILSKNGLIFSNLDSNVGGVAVIANNNEDKNLSTPQGESIYNLFTKEVNVEHEQVLKNITLYGKDEALTEIKIENSVENVKYYTIDITIKPLVARIEISRIRCAEIDIQGKIQSFNLHAIFMENTYEHAVLDSGGPEVSSLFFTDASTVESHPLDWWIYSYSSDFPDIPNNDPFSDFSPNVDDPTINGDGVFAFHFIPSSEMSPFVRLYLADNFANKSWYLSISGFLKNQTKVIFDIGYIYKITIPFSEKDVTEFDDNSKDMAVNVEVLNWTIINAIQPS